MSIIEELNSASTWEGFLAWRLKKGRFNWHDFESSDDFVASGECFRAVQQILQQGGPGIPSRILINKMGTGKKRVVYCYEKAVMEVLKLIAHLLYRYDHTLASNCFSFRRSITARDAILSIQHKIFDKSLWAYKIDIHDYFNSISIQTLLPILKEVLSNDAPIYHFFEKMLTNPLVREGDNVVNDEHGVLAGTPTAPFFANIYLKEMDYFFEKENVIYARYSDDIILFAPDRDTLNNHIATINGFLEKYKLKPNPDKERLYAPGQPFDYLGYKCHGYKIGLADATILKMKGKISRKARAFYRWQSQKQKKPEDAMKAIIQYFNGKFFDSENTEQLNWSRWFFPVINDVSGLREIDHYFQQNIRYVATGKHNGANYRIRYHKLRMYGYRSLVSEYYMSLEAKNSSMRNRESTS
ncbi:MAG: reverse transcriptase domain-containing protein [Prevotella sp.]